MEKVRCLNPQKNNFNHKPMKQLNKVSKKECMDAIHYLHKMGVVEEMGTDKKFYTEILLKKVANNYNIKLLT